MKKILIVVDMQNDFIDGSLGTKEAEAIVEKCSEVIRSFDGGIVVTFDTHYGNYLETGEGQKLPVPHCIKGTRGWELNYKIQKALEDKEYISLEKETFGAVNLPKILEENFDMDNTAIEFMGLCTDICVVSNALIVKSAYPETKISVYSDCMAGVTPEKHNAAIEVMKSCQIDVI